MFRFVLLVACVLASAQAGLVSVGSGNFATGPALGAPLLGRVTYNAPETTVVKQQVVVDQPEIRYRAVPTVVQTAPIIKTIQPVVQAAPVVQYAAAPAQVVQYAAAPAPVVQYAAAPAPVVQYAGSPAFQYQYAAAPGFAFNGFNGLQTIGGPAVTLLKK